MAINFKCNSCGKAYSVGEQNAGRAFNCTGCGVGLTVPQAAEVHMDGGSEVMRSPSSRRRAAAVPPKLLREQPAPPKKSNMTAIVVAVVVVMLIAGGAAAFLVLSPGPKSQGNKPVASTRDQEENPAEIREPSEREKLFEKLQGEPGTEALMALLVEAETLGLEAADQRRIAIRCVDSLCFTRGEGYTDAQIMQFAQQAHELQAYGEPERLYRLVIDRNRDADEATDAYLEARAKLGQYRVEIEPQLERVTELEAYGVLKGVGVYIDELESIRELSDAGWVDEQARNDFNDIVIALDNYELEIEELKQTNPFVFRVAESRRQFFSEKWGQRGTWLVEHRRPFVVFCQLRSSEREAQARERMENTLELLDQFAAFFRESLAEPMDLERELPADIPAGEREDAPIELLMFRDASHWRAYLRDRGIDRLVRDTVGYELGQFVEAGIGRASIPVEDDFETRMRGLAVEWLIQLYHPNTPETNPTESRWNPFNCYFIWKHFRGALGEVSTTQGRDGPSYSFFERDPKIRRALKQWLGTKQISQKGVVACGTPALTAEDIISTSGLHEVQPAMQKTLQAGGWTKEETDMWITMGQAAGMYHYYARGFIHFLYYWSPHGGSPKYRERFLEFLEADIRDEPGYSAPRKFREIFGADDSWDDFEADWLLYQQGD